MRCLGYLIVIVGLGLTIGTAGGGVPVKGGTIKWETGYPKTGAQAGLILVKGIATPDAGWVMQGNFVIVTIWQDGLTTQSFTIPADINTGKFGWSNNTWVEWPIQTGLANTKFNVIVSSKFVKDKKVSDASITQPRTATSK